MLPRLLITLALLVELWGSGWGLQCWKGVSGNLKKHNCNAKGRKSSGVKYACCKRPSRRNSQMWVYGCMNSVTYSTDLGIREGSGEGYSCAASYAAEVMTRKNTDGYEELDREACCCWKDYCNTATLGPRDWIQLGESEAPTEEKSRSSSQRNRNGASRTESVAAATGFLLAWWLLL